MSYSYDRIIYYLNIFFNDKYLKNKDKIVKLSDSISTYSNMVKRIKNSKTTYLNDDNIIKEKEARIKTLRQRRARLRNQQSKLLEMNMSRYETTMLLKALNREIVNEVVRGKYYSFPRSLGHIQLQYIPPHRNIYFINWGKSIENHLALTKKYAPIIYHKYKVEKSITKKKYFELSRPFVAPQVPDRLWLFYQNKADWFYIKYRPNGVVYNKFGNYYRFRFPYSSTSITVKNDLPDYKTLTYLSVLDTEEKIIKSDYVATGAKMPLLQILNPDYKYKLFNYEL
jgi:hypothetical protein